METRATHSIMLGPKLYCIVNEETNEVKHASRGISLKSQHNVELLKYENMKNILEDTEGYLPVVRSSGFMVKHNQLVTYYQARKSIHGGFWKRPTDRNMFSTFTYPNL